MGRTELDKILKRDPRTRAKSLSVFDGDGDRELLRQFVLYCTYVPTYVDVLRDLDYVELASPAPRIEN